MSGEYHQGHPGGHAPDNSQAAAQPVAQHQGGHHGDNPGHSYHQQGGGLDAGSGAGDFQQALLAAQAKAAALSAKLSAGGEGKRKLDDDGYSGGAPEAKRFHGEGIIMGETITMQTGEAVFLMHLTADKVGRIIGRGGATIKELEMRTGTRIQVDHKAEESGHKPVRISGPAHAVEECKAQALALLEPDGNGASRQTSGSFGGAVVPASSASGFGGAPGAGGYGALGGAAAGGLGGDASRVFECPASMVGRIIGRGGETIRGLQNSSGASITVDQNFPPDHPRLITVRGRSDSVEHAAKMLQDLIGGADTSMQQIIQRHGSGGPSRVVNCPKAMVGRVIGKGGETIKSLQKQYSVSIQIDQTTNPCKVSIAGQMSNVQAAEKDVMDIIEDRAHGGGTGGGMGGGGGLGSGGFAGGQGAGFGTATQQFPGAAGFGMANAYGGMAAGFAGYGGAPAFAGMGGYSMAQPGAFYGMAGFGMPGVAVDAYGGAYGTQQTQMQQPQQQQQQGQGQVGGGGGAVGSVWSEQRDDQGRIYYYNSVTGVSQWEKPAEMP